MVTEEKVDWSTSRSRYRRTHVDDVGVAGGVDSSIAAPAPRVARMLEHRMNEHVLEPDVDEI